MDLEEDKYAVQRCILINYWDKLLANWSIMAHLKAPHGYKKKEKKERRKKRKGELTELAHWQQGATELQNLFDRTQSLL